MAENAPSLGDFFKAKSKKKVKASNLNKAEEKKVEDKKSKTKATEDDAWEEEQVVASTMKAVEVAGKLMREEEKKDDEDTTAPAWGNVSKTSKETSVAGNQITERRFPTLAKSVGSSAINVDDGSDTKVGIQTSKNVFAALEGDDDEEDSKRVKEIKPAMVTKKKGEREKVALQREIDKFVPKKDGKKKAKEPSGEDDEDDDEEDDDDEAEEGDEAIAAEEQAPKPKVTEKKEDKKAKKPAQQDEEEECREPQNVEEDLKIQVDLVESKEKYKGRKKLPYKSIPREELEEEKENKPKVQQASGKKKKFIVEEETDKKMLTVPDDWD